MLHLSRTTMVKGGQNEQLNYYIVLSDLQFLLRPMCSSKNPPNFQPLSSEMLIWRKCDFFFCTCTLSGEPVSLFFVHNLSNQPINNESLRAPHSTEQLGMFFFFFYWSVRGRKCRMVASAHLVDLFSCCDQFQWNKEKFLNKGAH